MIIKVLGGGCSKCDKLEANVRVALSEMDIEASVEKVKDLKEIMAFGVMTTPCLVIDGKVKSVGKVASVKEIKTYL